MSAADLLDLALSAQFLRNAETTGDEGPGWGSWTT